MLDEMPNMRPEKPRLNENASRERPLDDATVSELLALLWRSPVATWRRLRIAGRRAAASPHEGAIPASPALAMPASGDMAPQESLPLRERLALRERLTRQHAQLLLYTIAIICALFGANIMRGNPSNALGIDPLQLGASYLWLGFALWLAADVVANFSSIQSRWRQLSQVERLRRVARLAPGLAGIGAIYRLAQSFAAPPEIAVGMALSALGLLLASGMLWLVLEAAFSRIIRPQKRQSARQAVMDRPPARPRFLTPTLLLRAGMALLAAASSLYIWQHTTGNQIAPSVIILWLLNTVLWCAVFAPLRWNVFERASGFIDMARRFSFRGYGLMLAALALTLAVGVNFRLERLDKMPGEMHSDLVINALDAYNIHVGADQRIFLPNNGGREPLHIYLYAIMGGLPGVGFNRYTLNLLAALESIATLPVMFWLGVEVIGRHRRRYAFGFALVATALLAASSWHVVMGRQGLRIPLAPLFTTLSAVYFVRGLRHNRRADFVLAGLTLTLGLYSYKSVRMLPVVYVACVGIALLLKRLSWRTRASYLGNLAVLAFVACMIFVPMFHFWVERPDQFTFRMTTRMFGDTTTTTEERLELFSEGVPTLLRNIRNSLLMFHYTSDSGLVSGAPYEPAMDATTSALLALGVAAWLSRLARRRDPIDWFVPCLLLAMLFIPTLAIAFPVEVPHYQRSSPAMPAAYLMAALPLALYCRLLLQALPRRIGTGAIALVAGALLLSAYQTNYELYFGRYMDLHSRSTLPHSFAGRVLRGFAESDGAYGNAFIVNVAHWWDHRAVAVEAGVFYWNNSGDTTMLPGMIRAGYENWSNYPLAPERDLLFFYAQHDNEALPLLQTWFPNGRASHIETLWDDRDFFIYRVPALGHQGLQDFINQYG